MDKFKEQDSFLYYKNELVATFIPVISFVEVLHNRVTDSYTYKYHVSIKTVDCEMGQKRVFDSLQNISFHKHWKECAGSDNLSKRQKKLLNEYLYLLGSRAPKREQECFNRITCQETSAMRENAWFELADYLVNLLTIKGKETEVLFLCKMAALMKPLFEKANHPMNFFIFLHGHSGVGKTVLAKLFFVQDPGQDKNFKMDSQMDVEKALQYYQGDTVLIDDYHPEASDYRKKKQNSVMDLLARQTDCNGKALAVSTAEIREGCFSLQDREIQIEISDTEVNWEKFAYVQKNIIQFKKLLYIVCHEIYANQGGIMTLIANNTRHKAGTFRITYYIETMKLVVAILEFVLRKTPLGNLLEKKMGNTTMGQHWYQLLDEIENRQNRYMMCLKDNENGIDLITVFFRMVNDEKVFRRVPGELMKKHSDNNVKDIYSFGAVIYVAERTLLVGIQRYFENEPEQRKEVRTYKKKMIEALKAEEILLVDNSKANTKKKNGKRFYEIDYKRLKYFCQLQDAK